MSPIRKPEYQMTDALPFLLWDYTYNSDVRWQMDDHDATAQYHFPPPQVLSVPLGAGK
ncbi:hypothetical protein F4604DRAFT_1779795 [Suillus subluteus]|nr:hypothetical protein F4604DRAFT_1779795 [Suillus subluteus]